MNKKTKLLLPYDERLARLGWTELDSRREREKGEFIQIYKIVHGIENKSQIRVELGEGITSNSLARRKLDSLFQEQTGFILRGKTCVYR